MLQVSILQEVLLALNALKSQFHTFFLNFYFIRSFFNLSFLNSVLIWLIFPIFPIIQMLIIGKLSCSGGSVFSNIPSPHIKKALVSNLLISENPTMKNIHDTCTGSKFAKVRMQGRSNADQMCKCRE